MEASGGVGGAVGAEWFGGDGKPEGAGGGRLKIEVRVSQVENRFAVAELEVHTAFADLDRRQFGGLRTLQKEIDVPLAGLVAREVDRRLDQPQVRKADLASEQAPEINPALDFRDVGERLDADAFVFGDCDVFDLKSGAAKDVVAGVADLDFASEGLLESGLDARGEVVGAKVRGADSGGENKHYEHRNDPGGLMQMFQHDAADCKSSR